MSDDLSLNGKLRVPVKWAVGVITALSTALGGSGAAMYRIGRLESEVVILRELCGKSLSAESSPDVAQK